MSESELKTALKHNKTLAKLNPVVLESLAGAADCDWKVGDRVTTDVRAGRDCQLIAGPITEIREDGMCKVDGFWFEPAELKAAKQEVTP